MGAASDVVLRLAHWVAAIDHSTLIIPAFGEAALVCLAITLLWLTLWSTKLRLLAIVPLVMGVTVAAKPDRPDIVIERDGSGLVVRGADDRFILAGRPSTFVLQQWLVADGDGRQPTDASLRQNAACDTQGCVVTARNGRRIAYAKDRLAVIEDCLRADLVVTPIPWSAPCAAKLIDRMALNRDGATSLIGTAGGWRMVQAERQDANRPWMRKRAATSPKPAQPPPAQQPERSDTGDVAAEPDRLQ
jgi:competence protein ComEC